MTLDIRNANTESLDGRRSNAVTARVQAQVAELQAFLRAQPDRDNRPANDLLGFDAFGLPR
jgi:hypothetical protein